MVARTDNAPRSRPARFKDRHLAWVDEWQSGCLYCGDPDVVEALPGSNAELRIPFCRRHVRWALATRRERVGKQHRHLRKLLLAWCRLHALDPEIAHRWLDGCRR